MTRETLDAGLERAAREIYSAADVIDLHLDTFIWKRIGGYDFTKRHTGSGIAGNFFGQVDLPRIHEAGITGAIWSITTNPFRALRKRGEVFTENLRAIERTLQTDPRVSLARNARDYRRARAAGKHAAFIGVQGGNAFSGDLDLLGRVGPSLIKVTVLHLLHSELGQTSTPLPFRKPEPLTPLGIELVKRLNAERVFVDLAHIGRAGFAAAVRAHDRSQPLICSHTGVAGVHPHWRNLEDSQIRAIADTGGVVGVIFQTGFLGKGSRGRRLEAVVDHLDHLVRIGGEEVAAIGSDWDGMITPPEDLKSCTGLPLLAVEMLRRGYTPQRIQRVLGGNFLRALAHLRP